MQSDLISIIIPVYRVEKYLKKCIESIINQSYKNLEIIIINDGSDDNSKAICETFAKKDNRIKVIHKENEGVSIARNKGLEEATGKYIAFIDSDDYVEKGYIEFLYNEIIKENADISICGTININEQGKILNKSIQYENLLDSRQTLIELLNEKYYTSVVWAKMYKTEIAKKAIFDKNLKISEDLDYIYKILKYVKKVKVNTSKSLYYYLIRENSATTNRYNENWEKEINLSEQILLDLKKKEEKEILPYAIRRYVRINYTCIMKVLRYNQENEIYLKLSNNIKKYLKEYLKSTKISIIEKIKTILALYFKNIVKILLKILHK